jgi:hypothetical protein
MKKIGRAVVRGFIWALLRLRLLPFLLFGVRDDMYVTWEAKK